MNASSTTELARERFHCPAWCEGGHHSDDVDVIDGSTWHSGPTFGSFNFAGITNADGVIRNLSAAVIDDRSWIGEYSDPAHFRKLAADALAAAAWIEGQIEEQQRTSATSAGEPLKAFRLAVGLTIEAAAELVGTSALYLAAVESGQALPAESWTRQVARTYGEHLTAPRA